MELEKVKIEYNLPQLLMVQAPQKIKTLEAGRGMGKSTLIGRHIKDTVFQLPRASGVIVGETYKQILTTTIPSTIKGLEMHGLIKDRHYFIGHKPPKSWGWPEPYEPPIDYKHFIIFWNGAGYHLVSQDREGSGRGRNADFVIGDEAALLDYEKLDLDVLATNRGNQTHKAIYGNRSMRNFGDCPLHHSELYTSTTPLTTKGMWMFKNEQNAVMDPQKYFYLRASSFHNRKNLGEEWFSRMKQSMPDFIYDAEIRNIRVKRVKDGFYPSLDEGHHCYTNFDYSYYDNLVEGRTPTCDGDDDHARNIPLQMMVDWGASINCMVIGQHQKSSNTFRFLKNFYVKSPQIMDDVVDDHFAPYYRSHQHRFIYLWYDSTGNNAMANSRKNLAQQLKARLEHHGWTVQLMTKGGSNPLHEKKFAVWNKMLREEDPYLPVIRFNSVNCKELIISMKNAPAKQGYNDAIKKDKKSERSKSIDQAHATHFSDAADTGIYGLFGQTIEISHDFIPPITT